MPMVRSVRASVLALMACGLAAPALAHAHLVRETPSANAVLTAAPTELRLTFSEGL